MPKVVVSASVSEQIKEALCVEAGRRTMEQKRVVTVSEIVEKALRAYLVKEG